MKNKYFCKACGCEQFDLDEEEGILYCVNCDNPLEIKYVNNKIRFKDQLNYIG